jgi:hypothetical protein
MFDYDALRFWLTALSVLVSSGAAIYAWWTARNRATSEAIQALKADLDKAEREIDRLKGKVDAMPNHRDMEDVKGELSGLRADVAKLIGSMAPLTRMTELMTEHLMSGQKR